MSETVSSRVLLVKVISQLRNLTENESGSQSSDYTEPLSLMPSASLPPSPSLTLPPSCPAGTTPTSTGCRPLATRTWMPIWQNRPGCTPQSSTCSALSMRSTLTSASTARRSVNSSVCVHSWEPQTKLGKRFLHESADLHGTNRKVFYISSHKGEDGSGWMAAEGNNHNVEK